MNGPRFSAAGIDANWLRSRFLVGAPSGGNPEAAASVALTPAAVLVPVVVRPEGLTMLLTQRTEHLHDHPGQVSFPGGRCESSDASPTVTALREAEEEVGLRPEQVDVIGRLPRYQTGTGFHVTPVVGLVRPPLELRPDPFEVAEVFETPLEFLLDPANHRRVSMEIAGAWREFWAVPYEDRFIWGATAAMIVSLYRFLSGDE